MKIGGYTGVVALLTIGLLPAAGAGVQQKAESGKVAITTSSSSARQAYLEGRNLAEMIRGADARQYYLQAVAQDEYFAIAHLGLANTSPTAKQFFESLSRAVAAAKQASKGEQLMIHAQDAGVQGQPEKQKKLLIELVSMYPNDERAHNLMGNLHFGRQDYAQAISEYRESAQINPNFSAPYNSMGYAQRALGQYSEAEKSFQKYIELIPDQPNPYDSYAELLMKMGRFEESIENYEKALTHDRNFVASYVGIGNNQIFLGNPAKARETFKELEGIARNVGQRRQAAFWTAASFVYEGNTEAALKSVKAMYGIAEQGGDHTAMSGDLNLMGSILLYAGQPDEALSKYRAALKEARKAVDTPERVKAGAERAETFNEARVALAKKDMRTAKSKTEAYGTAVKRTSVPFELRNYQELLGLVALHEEDYSKAVTAFEQANQQNPRIIYFTALAYKGKGDSAKARELAEKAANFNGLTINFAYFQAKAEKLLQES